MMGGYVKKGMQEASAVMIERMRRKAELLDEGRLVAMFEDGKLKTTRPTAAATFDSERPLPSPSTSAPGSPQPMSTPQFESRDLKSPGFTKYHNLVGRNESVRSSAYIPSYQQGGYNGPQYYQQGVELPASYPSNEQQQGQQGFVSELPGSYYQQQPNNNLYPQPLKPQGQSFRAELAGDTNLAPPQASQDYKQPTPPNGTHPAYQQGSSPQPSPRLPPPTNSGAPSPRLPASNGHPSPNPSQRSNSGYQITNPDQQQQQRPASYQQQERPASYHRQSSNNSNSVQQWQQSVANDTPIDDNYYRNSRHSHTNPPAEPDHQRFSSLAIGQQPPSQPQQQQQYSDASDDRTSLPSQTAKCPVCGLFEGDEKAVSHHVSKAHFQ